jgi:cysteine desulfurase/selenocysteine lyase
VIDAVSHAYENEYANVHRGLHFLSNAATDAYEGAREKVRRFLNAPSSRQIMFTKSATEAINTVAYGTACRISARATRSSCRSWSTTPTSCRGISCASGRARRWSSRPVDDQGNFDLDDFRKALTDRTKLVAIAHMSNVLGTVVT